MREPTEVSAGPAANPWPTFAVCAIAAYIATLDMSIVNVAFAEIARSFPGSSRGTISWVVTAYSILFGSLLVVSGRLADRVGRRRLLLIGTGLFLAGSLACALSPGLGLLVAGRAVQGVGGALMVPASLGLLLGAFPATRRSQAIAWNGAVGALGVASGPTLGALCVAAFGWRSAFWINVPICLVVAVMAWRVVPESPRSAGPRPDVAAAVVLTVSVASLVWAISRAETLGWSDRSVVGLLVLAVALGAVVVQRSRRHPRPLLPPSLFTRRTATAANLATVVFGIAFSANLLNNVLFLRTVWRYGVVRAGLFSVLAPVVVAVTSVVAGRLMRRVGFRPLLLAGPLGMAAVAVGQARLLTDTPTPVTRWLPLMFLLGVGIGSTFPVLAAASVHGLPAEHFALGGAVNNTARQVGAAVGVALVVTIQATADGIAGFRAGWLFVAACCGLAAAVSLAQPRRASASAPAGPASPVLATALDA